MKYLMIAFAAVFAAVECGAITATKEYVDRKDAAVATAATNYTDAAIAGVSGVTPLVVTNIANGRIEVEVAPWARSGQPTPAPGNYATVSNAAMTAVQPNAIADMETKTHAAATYQPKGNYLTSESDPVWTADKPNYLLTATAASTYLALTGGTVSGNLTVGSTLVANLIETAGTFIANQIECNNFTLPSESEQYDFYAADPNYKVTMIPDNGRVITSQMTNELAQGILTVSGRDCAGKIAALSNNVTRVLKVTQGDSAWEYNGTEAVQIDLAQGGGGTDGAAVTNIVASIFPSNRVFGVDGGLLTAYDVSADGARTNEIWREARGYAMTNGYQDVEWKTRGLDGTITTITIGDAATAAAGVSVDLPSAWDAEARDFAVYVFNGTTNAAPLRLPTNVSIYGYYANATNELKRDTVTALYFTEIRRDTFLLGRAEIISLQEGSHLPTEGEE